MKSLDILFVSEHWLLTSEIMCFSKDILNNYDVFMKSSMTSEDLTTAGRPFGGVGFVCKRKTKFTYDTLQCESDRLIGLEVNYHGTKVLTIYGAYMPYHNGSARQTELYMSTLNELDILIEETSGPAPFLVMGDMNTELPMSAQLRANWYKEKPYNKHSPLLYDFLCDNELVMCNIKQSSHDFTYHNGSHISYIDYVFINSYAWDKIVNCCVLYHEESNNSDHLGVLCEIVIDCPEEADEPSCPVKCQRRPKWDDAQYQEAYAQSLQHALSSVPLIDPSRVEPGIAQAVINSQCSQICKAMHHAASAGLSKGANYGRRKVHWWTRDCTIHRDRTKLYFHIWKCMNRPRTGQAYECYKSARRSYKKVCRDASNAAIKGGFLTTSNMLKCNKIQQFWKMVNSAKPKDNTSCKVSRDALEHFYEQKFKKSGDTTDTMTNCHNTVSAKISQLQSDVFASIFVTEHDVVKCIKQLTCNKAAGSDGLTAEHYLYGLGSSLPLHLSTILTICLQHGAVPESFLHGILTPLYKTGKDPYQANSYRPVTVSVTFSKILEIYILDKSQHNAPHPAQFGYIDDRGTDMAIALAHDVAQYFTSNGSSIFTCSLDAEGAFDHIPHSVLFAKMDGVVSDPVWRLLYRWYGSMFVSIKLNGSLGRKLKVERGVRQGGITSPWMFNIFYEDLVKNVNVMNCGLNICDKRFNIFCYADDLLVASTTTTGLQALMDTCERYVKDHGLSFNASKTCCTIVGKSPIIGDPQFMLNNTAVKLTETFKYLGAELGNKGASIHVNNRIKATNAAYYKFQSAGMHSGGLSPEAAKHAYLLAIQPTLIYAAHAIHMTSTDVQKIESVHGRILKTSLGLSKFSRTSPLLAALNIQRLERVVENQTLNLMRRCMTGNSLASTFYWTLYKCGNINGKTLLGRSSDIFKKYGLNFSKVIFSDVLNVNTKSVIYENNPKGKNGLVDSLCAIFNDYTIVNQQFARLLLRY